MNVKRLNYIGSKFKLLDWLVDSIKERTGWEDLCGKTIGDLFAGTGIVTWHLRTLGATTVSNDAELYSSVITRAMARSTWTPRLARIIERLNEIKGTRVGFVTENFSPWGQCERKFFTTDNAQRIDWMRQEIETLRPTLDEDEYAFLVASLVVSADSVSNVPAVYGMYLKNFKAKAGHPMTLVPVHTSKEFTNNCSKVFQKNIVEQNFGTMDAVYLDPPYNERQYSKNYFPLNLIAMSPEVASRQGLHGKTGIPDEAFVSPFCQKRRVKEAFETLIPRLDAKWIFLSYNSESLLTKDEMMGLLGKYGEVQVKELDYKRFKSFEYNDGSTVTEYLFSVHMK